MKINVYEITGQLAITLDDGENLYQKIHPALSSNEYVELDFENVTIFASPFFNAGIGALLRDISSENLNRLLKIENITPVGYDVLRSVIENAKQYYALTETGRIEYDAIVNQNLEDN